MKIVAIFNSTRDVVTAEELCRRQGIAVKVVPMPKEYSKNCGMALCIDEEREQELVELMEKENIDVTIQREKRV